MKLQDALKNIVRHHGIDVLCEARIVNILSDNNAFENRATKMVLRNMLELGYLTKVIELDDVCDEQRTLQLMTICQNIVNEGFQERIVKDIINSISYALGWTNTTFSQVEDATPTTDILQTLSSVFDRTTEVDYDLDEFGVAYSCDGKRLLFGNENVTDYIVREGVLVICDNAFRNLDSELNSVVLPESLLIIGDNAFSAKKLKSINLPNSLAVIGKEAFSGCDIESLEIPNNVLIIGGAAFRWCNIKEFKNSSPAFTTLNGVLYSSDLRCLISEYQYNDYVDIPEGVEVISSGVFWGVSEWYVKFPSTLKIIEDEAFSCCWIESLELPYGIQHLGNSAFSGCNNLRNIHLPNSVETIGESCFANCENLNEVVLSQNLKEIQNGTFHGCMNLETIQLTDNIEIIGEYSFKWCKNLHQVTLPVNLKTLNVGVFDGCSKLKELRLPRTLSYISGNPFLNCNPKSIVLDTDLFRFENNILYSADYKQLIAYLGNERDVIINDNVRHIGDYAFYRKGVYHIHFPKCLKSIGKYSFYECKKLQDCDLSQTNLETIGKEAFKNCTNIVSVNMPDTVLRLEDFVFQWCKKLCHVILSAQISTIGDYMFWGCSNLEYVTSLKHVVYIGRSAFLDCKKLKNIELSCIESLGSGALNSQIRKITIPIGSKDRIESVLTKSYHQQHVKYLEESDLL